MENLIFQTEPIEDFYDFKEELGRGNFAIVKRCQRKETGEAFAAKCITKKRSKASKRGMSKEAIEIEAGILMALDHEAIIKLYDVFETKLHITLIMELLTGGELFEEIAKEEFILEKDACHYMKQVLNAIEHMHSRNIVHLDLKPENIVLHYPGSKDIKLIDFGLAKILKPGQEIREMMGTPEFAAPEVINFDVVEFYTDMWAIGVVTYILLSGASPFLGDDDQETYKNITSCEYQFDDEYFEKITPNAKDFIEKLLLKKPKERNTVKDCLNHPWIASEETENSIIDTQKMRAFVARRRWKQSLKLVSTISRLKILCRNSIPSPTSDVSGDEADAEVNGKLDHKIGDPMPKLPQFTDRNDLVEKLENGKEKDGNFKQDESKDEENVLREPSLEHSIDTTLEGGSNCSKKVEFKGKMDDAGIEATSTQSSTCGIKEGFVGIIPTIEEPAVTVAVSDELEKRDWNLEDDHKLKNVPIIPSNENREERVCEEKFVEISQESLVISQESLVNQLKKSSLHSHNEESMVTSNYVVTEEEQGLTGEELSVEAIEADVVIDPSVDENDGAVSVDSGRYAIRGHVGEVVSIGGLLNGNEASATNRITISLPVNKEEMLEDQKDVASLPRENTNADGKLGDGVSWIITEGDGNFAGVENSNLNGNVCKVQSSIVNKHGVFKIRASNNISEDGDSSKIETSHGHITSDDVATISPLRVSFNESEQNLKIGEALVDEDSNCFTVGLPNETEEEYQISSPKSTDDNMLKINQKGKLGQCGEQAAVVFKIGISKDRETEQVQLRQGPNDIRVVENVTVNNDSDMVIIELIKSDNNNV